MISSPLLWQTTSQWSQVKQRNCVRRWPTPTQKIVSTSRLSTFTTITMAELGKKRKSLNILHFNELLFVLYPHGGWWHCIKSTVSCPEFQWSLEIELHSNKTIKNSKKWKNTPPTLLPWNVIWCSIFWICIYFDKFGKNTLHCVEKVAWFKL